jgi:hypothetical protein
MRRKWLRVFVVVIALSLVGGVLFCYVFGFPFQFTRITARIESAGLCRGPQGGVTDIFPPNAERVYLYVLLKSNTWLQMRFRWYYEDQLIGTSTERMNPGLNYTWLERSQGQAFPEGEYHVEVIVGDWVEKRLDFQIRASDDKDI